jgi:hypothetical protein
VEENTPAYSVQKDEEEQFYNTDTVETIIKVVLAIKQKRLLFVQQLNSP